MQLVSELTGLFQTVLVSSLYCCDNCFCYVSDSWSHALALVHNATFIRFLILVLYILFACLHRMLRYLSFFLHFFLKTASEMTYIVSSGALNSTPTNQSLLISSFTYNFPLRIDPLHFQAGCCKRRLNLALVFCVYFV